MSSLLNVRMIALALVVIVLPLGLWMLNQNQASQVKVSEFGKYQGYSPAMYDGSKRVSEYLTLSNGTRLAYDLILPTKSGVAAGERLPVLFK